MLGTLLVLATSGIVPPSLANRARQPAAVDSVPARFALTTRRQPTAVTAAFNLQAPASLIAIRWRRSWPNIPVADLLAIPGPAVFPIGEHRVSFRRQAPAQATAVGGALPSGNARRDAQWATDFVVVVPASLASGSYEVLLLQVPEPVPVPDQQAALAELGGAESVTALAGALVRRWSRSGAPVRWALVQVPPTL